MAQLVKIGSGAALDDPTATSLALDSTSMFHDAIEWLTSGLVADAIAASPTVVAAAESAAGTAVTSIMSAALFHRRALTTSENLNSVTQPGVYTITTNAVAQSLVNFPEPVTGTLVVTGAASGLKAQMFFPNVGGLMVRTIQIADSSWTRWENLSKRPLTLPSTVTDIATFNHLGNWRVTLTAASTLANKPPIPAGAALLVVYSHNGTQNGTMRVWYDAEGNGVWFQSAKGAGGWTDWHRLGSTGSAATRDYSTGHTVRKQREQQATGGPIGTAGKGVVAIRIDHNMKPMMEKVLPLLRARSLPASMCHYVDQFQPEPAGDDSAGYSWADVQTMALQDGVEVWSHSWTHRDATSQTALEHEIIDSRVELETQMPKTRVRGLMVPGTEGTFWGGFTNNLGNPLVWRDTEAGRLVQFQYASANGGGGVLNPLAADQTLGWQSYAIDSSTSSSVVTGLIRQAADMGTGAAIMLHPNMVDHASGIPSSVLVEILDFIAAERDAGRVEVLTVWGMLQADPARAGRHNLVRDAGFAQGLARWSDTTGWSVASGVASTTTGARLTQALSLTQHHYSRGSSRELFVEARATGGAVVRVAASDSASSAAFQVSKDVTLPASPDWKIIRQPLLLPAAGTDGVRLEFGRVSGGAVELRNPGLLAI